MGKRNKKTKSTPAEIKTSTSKKSSTVDNKVVSVKSSGANKTSRKKGQESTGSQLYFYAALFFAVVSVVVIFILPNLSLLTDNSKRPSFRVLTPHDEEQEITVFDTDNTEPEEQIKPTTLAPTAEVMESPDIQHTIRKDDEDKFFDAPDLQDESVTIEDIPPQGLRSQEDDDTTRLLGEIHIDEERQNFAVETQNDVKSEESQRTESHLDFEDDPDDRDEQSDYISDNDFKEMSKDSSGTDFDSALGDRHKIHDIVDVADLNDSDKLHQDSYRKAESVFDQQETETYEDTEPKSLSNQDEITHAGDHDQSSQAPEPDLDTTEQHQEIMKDWSESVDIDAEVDSAETIQGEQEINKVDDNELMKQKDFSNSDVIKEEEQDVTDRVDASAISDDLPQEELRDGTRDTFNPGSKNSVNKILDDQANKKKQSDRQEGYGDENKERQDVVELDAQVFEESITETKHSESKQDNNSKDHADVSERDKEVVERSDSESKLSCDETPHDADSEEDGEESELDKISAESVMEKSTVKADHSESDEEHEDVSESDQEVVEESALEGKPSIGEDALDDYRKEYEDAFEPNKQAPDDSTKDINRFEDEEEDHEGCENAVEEPMVEESTTETKRIDEEEIYDEGSEEDEDEDEDGSEFDMEEIKPNDDDIRLSLQQEEDEILSSPDESFIEVSRGVTKQILKEGTGEKIDAGDIITIHCNGYLDTDPPKKFWSTKDPSQRPFTFSVGKRQVIKGWDEGALSMTLHERSRIKVEAKKAYGKFGFEAWGIPPGASIILEMEVIEHKRMKSR